MKHALEVLLDAMIQEIFENFAASFGTTILLFSTSGEVLSRGSRNSCFCDLVQNRIFTPALCQAADDQAREKCAREQRLFNYRCHAGIEEAVAPIRVGGENIGFAMFGQFRTTKEPLPLLLERCPVGERQALRNAFASLPYIEPERKMAVVGLFGTVISYIAERELVRPREALSFLALEKWMRKHCAEPLTVADAARMLHCSRSTVTHQLKRKWNCSFQEFLIRCRLDEAETLLKTGKCLTVKEAAAAVGYDDPGYFCRLYRKKRGVAPGVLKNC